MQAPVRPRPAAAAAAAAAGALVLAAANVFGRRLLHLRGPPCPLRLCRGAPPGRRRDRPRRPVCRHAVLISLVCAVALARAVMVAAARARAGRRPRRAAAPALGSRLAGGVTRLAQTGWAAGAEALERAAAAQVAAQLDRLTAAGVAAAKAAVVDPAMPDAVASAVGDAVDRAARAARRRMHAVADDLLLAPLRRQARAAGGGVGGGHDGRGAAGRGGGGGGGAGGGGINSHPPQPSPVSSWAAARAWVLYTLSPHDKSAWATLRDPAWWALSAVGVAPPALVTNAWWLLLWVWRDKGDEYQLADFIVSFETAKFLSNGVWGLVHGAALYFLCVQAPAARPCGTHGPGLTVTDAAAFALQVATVLAAYTQLRRVEPRGGGAHRGSPSRAAAEAAPTQSPPPRAPPPPSGVQAAAAAVAVAAAAAPATPGRSLQSPSVIALSPLLQRLGVRHPALVAGDNAGPGGARAASLPAAGGGGSTPAAAAAAVARPAGGRRHAPGGILHALYGYHCAFALVCVVIAAAAAAADAVSIAAASDGANGVAAGALAGSAPPPLLGPTLFWLRVLYGLLSAPFIVFKLPGVMRLYVCDRPTGYDALGRTQPCGQRAGDGTEAARR
jgi:hypothetical protein